MKLPGGDVEVTVVTGFRTDEPIPLVQITVSNSEGKTTIFMSPANAQKIGLDMIGAGFSAVSDATMRRIAQKHGLDGDALILLQRELTEKELP